MPRYKGDKFRWKGVTDCTQKAKMYSQFMFNEGITLDLWLTADEKRVYVTDRNWIDDPEPPEPKAGELYCGEVNRHDAKTGDIELKVLQALDKRDNPWRYKEWHFFLVNPKRKTLIEIPRYHPIGSKSWDKVAEQFDADRLNVCAMVYCAASKALVEFNKHPEATEFGIIAGNIPVLVRGHGYYDT